MLVDYFNDGALAPFPKTKIFNADISRKTKVNKEFSPLDFSPVVFLRSDRGVAVSDAVDKWLSGDNERHLFSNTGTNRPSFVANQFNGHPGIQFTTDDYLIKTGTGIVDNGSGHVFIVFKLDDTTGTQTFFSSSDTASATRYLAFQYNATAYTDDMICAQSNADTADIMSAGGTISTATTYFYEWKSTGGVYSARLNTSGETIHVESGSNNGDWWLDSGGRDNAAVGALVDDGGAQDFGEFTLGIMLIYDTNLSNDNRTRVENWCNTWAAGGALF